MRDLVLHVPTGIVLDLSVPGYGHEDGLDIIAEVFGHCHRGVLICDKHHSDLFLQYREGRYTGRRLFGIHFDGGHAHEVASPMSDEHKRQAEYWVRAAQDAGWAAELEFSLPTATRPDALIFGPVMTGVEVQRSAITLDKASQRSRKALAAGVTDIWYTAAGISLAAGKLYPKWAHRIPTVGSDDIPWTGLPPRRSATATGLRKLFAKECNRRNFALCPETNRQVCGRYHVISEAWRGITVDDVAAQFPAGEIVALRTAGRARSGNVFLVSAADADLYEQVTGYRAPAPVAPGSVPRARAAPGRIECASDQPILPLYVPPTQAETGSSVETFSARPAPRRKPGTPCEDCGYPMPDGTCQRQGCRVARTYRGQRGLT